MKVYYSADKWKDYGDYYIYEDDQRTIGWKQARMGRVTGSTVSECIGNKSFRLNKSPLESQTNPLTNDPLEDPIVQVALEIAGVKEKVFTEESKRAIDHGILHESNGRDWYSRVNQVQVIEAPFGVPKFDGRIGASPDGIIIQNNQEMGLLEIKCPQRVYQSIIDYINHDKPYTEEYSHIPRGHYDQMQMNLAIFNKEWCDYLIYCTPEEFVFLERVHRNRKYWDSIYSKIQIFIDGVLQPILNFYHSKYPLLPGVK